MKNILGLFAITLLIISCATNRDSNTNLDRDGALTDMSSGLEDIDPNVDLTTHLRKFSGLTIVGDGQSAKLSVRGMNSFTAGTEPLLILDRAPVSSYYELFHNVRVSNIKRIEVLKNPNEVAIYGVRGANGVITITTKKG